MKGKALNFSIICLGFLALFGGLLWLINLRFNTGDVYPRGSSLRSDPMGSKALFQSYTNIVGLNVERNFVPFDQVSSFPDESVLIMLNMRRYDLFRLRSESTIDDFLEKGGRLILGLNPKRPRTSSSSTEEDEVVELGENTKKQSEEDSEPDQILALKGLDLVKGEEAEGVVNLVAKMDSLPDQLKWHSGAMLEVDTKYWQTLYESEGQIAMAQRSYGKGSIVVMGDDYLFTNDALLRMRSSDLLVWVLGGKTNVIFDETHLGVIERTGIVGLLRRYQLESFFAALGLLFVMLVWRGASPFLPPYSMKESGNLVRSEQSTESGLADLIRRSISNEDLPAEAFRVWKESTVRGRQKENYWAAELVEVERLLSDYRSLPRKKKNAAALHLDIQTVINRKKRRHSE